jgi:3-oxoacyl-[acyl-carrier-protein] synthase II
MPALIAASAIRTCFGDGERTFEALLRGASGVAPLRHYDGARLHVGGGYHVDDTDDTDDGMLFRPSRWLAACVAAALAACPSRTGERVMVVVGTGLRELRAVERHAVEGLPIRTERLHFESCIRAACPGIDRVITLSNACSAGGHALALAQDLIELGEADLVVAAATDAFTASMLAMIGRFALEPTTQVRPFDRDRQGVLLGEGAAAMVVVAEGRVNRPLARLLGTGLSCDAAHETIPDVSGILRAVDDALARAGRMPADVDLVVTHGTGTALNDPTEAAVLVREFAGRQRLPLVTGLKGALGHTSGSAALMSVDVALRCLASGIVPPIVGLREPIPEAAVLPCVTGAPRRAPLRLAQVNAFGFGGVNAVTLLEAAA